MSQSMNLPLSRLTIDYLSLNHFFMSRFIKHIPIIAFLILSHCVHAQYDDSTFMISFEPNVTQVEIDLALEDFNAEEIDITPISNTRLWKVTSFPFTYPPTGEFITDINETKKKTHHRSGTNSGGLNYIASGVIGSTIPPTPNIPNDPQNDCLGELSTYIVNGSNEVKVGIFDTGLNYYGNPNIPEYYFDLEGFDQWDHLNDDPIAEDDMGHGSHMASVVSHTINKAYGLGQSLTEPEEYYDVRKSFDEEGEGYLFEIIDAMEEAALDGMNIASCSWSFKATEFDALKLPLYRSLSILGRDYNVMIVAAAGNDAENIDNHTLLKNYPASYDLDNILTATSFNCSFDLTTFANWGSTSIDIALPGNNLAGLENDNIVHRSGTSQSTALLAGIAASLGTHQAQFDYFDIICAIMSSAQYHSIVSGKVKSDGIIDANEALNYLGNCSHGGYGRATKELGANVSIHPNPSHGQFTLVYHSEIEQQLSLSVIDALGRSHTSLQIMAEVGENKIEIDSLNLTSGIYYLVIQTNNNMETVRYIIEVI